MLPGQYRHVRGVQGSHWDLILTLVIVAWVLVVVFTILALVLAVGTKSTINHTMYAFSGKVPLWRKPDDNAGSLPEHAVPQDYEENVAAYLLDQMARYMAEYSKETETFPTRPGTKVLARVYTEGGKQLSAMLVNVPDSDATLLLFKGTTTAAEWSVDFNYAQKSPTEEHRTVSWNEKLPEHLRMHYEPLRTSSSSGVLLHAGFLEMYRRMRGRILDALHFTDTSRLYICGHSLGGGLANIAMFDLLRTGFYPVNACYCVTLGSPRAGNSAFADWMGGVGARLFQLRNEADIVPQMPLAWTPSLSGPYVLYEFQHAGTGMVFRDQSTNLKGAHMLYVYQEHTANADLISLRF